MVNVGDILTIEGKKVIVTFTDGVNYAYAPYKEKKKAIEKVDPEETVEEPVEEVQEIKPRRRRKKD
jgi:ASC-1-like (ASCH) protein